MRTLLGQNHTRKLLLTVIVVGIVALSGCMGVTDSTDTTTPEETTVTTEQTTEQTTSPTETPSQYSFGEQYVGEDGETLKYRFSDGDTLWDKANANYGAQADGVRTTAYYEDGNDRVRTTVIVTDEEMSLEEVRFDKTRNGGAGAYINATLYGDYVEGEYGFRSNNDGDVQYSSGELDSDESYLYYSDFGAMEDIEWTLTGYTTVEGEPVAVFEATSAPGISLSESTTGRLLIGENFRIVSYDVTVVGPNEDVLMESNLSLSSVDDPSIEVPDWYN